MLTLALEPETQERFEAERQRWFPAGRTQVGAHVTLFHALPADLRAEVDEELAALARLPAPAVRVRGVRSLGRGVAYDLTCDEVEGLHRGWQRRWSHRLTRQDAQGLRLHVTVQNKVEPEVARRTLAQLERDVVPWTCHAAGVRLWRYDGGPWTHLADGAFGPPA